jgi:hypothetical protein
MNFSLVFKWLIDNFSRRKIDYALIGGFGMHASGVVRTTRDIDFLIPQDAVPVVKKLMTSHGYKCIYESEDVSNYLGTKIDLGRVDFLHAHRGYTRAMLARAALKKILDGKFELKVLAPEDLIGLKVQSMVNDPSRYNRDMNDIQSLIFENRETLDMQRVREYFKLFGLEKTLEDVMNRVPHVKPD